MAKTQQLLQTNFSSGELSDLIGGRPDFQKYYNGALRLENVWIYPEGGIFRRWGTVVMTETKDSQLGSDRTARLVNFEVSTNLAYLLEFGQNYVRIWINHVLLAELATPYIETDLPDIQYAQSADVLFMVHSRLPPQRLNRHSDTDWTFTSFNINPLPSREEDTAFGSTLTPGATTGTTTFDASVINTFLPADVGRHLKGKDGNGEAVISTYVSDQQVTGRIISDFPNTNPIASGDWHMTGSPNTALDPDVKQPQGSFVTLTTTIDAFHPQDLNKYIKLWGGLVQIVQVTDFRNIIGTIQAPLEAWTTSENPDPSPAGAWTLEEPIWSDAKGWPDSITFHQGRLVLAHDDTFAGSASDAFDNFSVGSIADRAYQYSLKTRNPIQWLESLGSLFIGDTGVEHLAKGKGVDAPIGGDEIPFLKDQSFIGSVHTMPVVCFNTILFINRFMNKIYELSYDIAQDSYIPKNRTLLARQIGQSKFVQHPLTYAQEPNSIIFAPLQNGQLGCLTYDKLEDVIGWTRTITDGTIESVAALPTATGHEVYIVVRRLINGAVKHFIEIFAESFNSDCTVTGTILTGATTITGLSGLEGKTLDLILGDSYAGQFTVTGGQIILNQQIYQTTAYQVGLHYDSTIQPMRPTIPNSPTDGRKIVRQKVILRLKDTIGGKVNGLPLRPLTDDRPYTGIVFANPTGADYDGLVTITQDEPYPFTLLNVTSTVDFADETG